MKAIEQYFNYLKDAGADVPSTADSFKKTLSDKSAAEQYYGYLKQNNFDAPESFDSFANTLGLNKPATVPVKKKDGSDPLSLDTPSVSGLNPEDPIPSVSALLKQRKKLKAEKEAPKPTSAPGFALATVETAPVIDYDAQISKIDEQIKAKGFDPDELDVKFGEYDIDLDDNKLKELYNNYRSKPFATTRQLNATTWHQAIERVQSKNPDEQLKQKNLGELKKLISDGYKLPSYDLNTAINFGRNAYQQILTLTADGDGKDREIAIENFKKDYSPVLAQIALRDKKFSSQQNLPLQMGLLYEDIFDKSKADQTRAYLSQDLSGNPDAVSGRDRIRYGTEENGLSMIQAGAGEEIEDKYDNIKKWLDWQKNNIGKLSDLGQKIAVANPEIKATIDAANIEIQKINKSVESSPLVLELNKQKDIADQYENDYKAGIIGRDIYVAEVDRYNELYEQYKKEVSQAKYKAEQIANVANEKAASSGVSPEELKEYNRLKGEFEILENERGLAERANIWSNYFTKEKNKIVKNNPTVVADKIIMQMQEWDGENSNPLERFFLSLGSVVPKAADAFEIIYDSLVSSPEKKQENDLERAGRSGTDNLIAFYNTNKSNVIQSPMITVVPESIEKRRREIDANPKLNEAEREEAKKRILRDGFLSGEIYQTTNPNAGKINITAKSILNSAVTVVPQILTAAGLSYITGGAASGVAVSTFLNGYSSYYNDAVSQGIANPNQYAFSHSLIDFGFEMFGTKDLKLIQSAVKGYKGVGAKFFKDLTDAEFKSLLAGSKNAFKDTRKALISNLAINAGETGEEIGAQVAGNVIDQELFGIKKPATEGVTETFLTTSLGQMPLTLLGIPLSVNKTNIANKYALYNASTDVNGTMAFLKKELDAGNLTSQEYTDRVKLVNDYAKAIKETPATYADGNPMRDDDKAKYAFNQFISNMKADKSPLPPQQKQSIDQVIADAENENDKILSNATNESKVQEGGAEGNLIQPQGVIQGQQEVGQGAGSQGQAEVTTANVGDSNISGQGQVAPPGKRLFNEPNPEAAVIETEFKKSKGIDTPEPAPITKLDEEKSKKIADAYDQLVDNPNDPEVQQAYQAMADETMEQFGAIDKAGVKVEIWTGKGEPYKNSGEMIADVRDNKHMYIFSTEEGFGDTPITEEQRQQNALLRDSGIKDVNGKPLLINDIFRFVHDYFGHTRLGNSFGAIGEENAWNVHARMYSPLARRAMTTETRGQNSWVNFNSSYRKADGTMKKKGDEGYVPPAQRPFADQKMALLPEEFSNIEDSYSLKSAPTKIDQALNQAIPNAEKSLQEAGIKIQVVDAATDTEEARAARGNQGLFRSEDGTVIIDKSKLANEIESGLVVWHEASHPVMNIIRNTDKPLYDAVVRGLKQAAKKNKGVAGALNWAQSQEQYDNEDTQNDESVVETIGRINAGLIDINSLDTGLRQKLIDFINSIAKYFGIDPILNDRDIAAFKKTVSEVADALKTGRDISEIVGKENVKEFKAPSSQAKAVTIAKGTESLKRFGLPEGRNTTRKIGEALESRTRDKYGIIGRNDRSESALRKIASWMTEEVKYFIDEFGENSGKGWYGEKFQKGIDKMAEVFPELATDQNSRDLFTMLVAITSDGTEVMENFKQASKAYEYYKKNDKMPETASAQRAASYETNFRNIQRLLDDNNGDIAAIKKYLLNVSSISDLNKLRKTEGLEALSTSWPASFEVPVAASIFGPKLGMFYANLSGMENYPTLDRWWSRTFNRYRGTLIPQITRGFNKKGQALGIDAYREVTGMQDASEDEVIARIIQDHDSYEAKGYKKGTVAEKKANTLYKKLFVELNDAPFGKNDRKFMYDAFVNTKKRLKASGIDVSIADIQAILWYFEKNLYKKLGVTKPILGISYEEAAAKTVDRFKSNGNTFNYEIKEEDKGETIEEIDEVDEEVQASVGNRSEEDLRAEGTGKERPRALASKYGNLNPATQAKIEDDATVYFQRTNKQTKEAVDKFLDGLNIMDAADYVLSNPKIPEVSQVWMAAEIAKRLNAEIDAAKDQDLIDDLTRKQGDVFNEFAKKATSLGQAVQAFIAFKDNPNAVEFFLPKILRQLKKAGVENVTEEQRAEILTLLKDVNTAAEGLPKDKAIIKLSHYLAGIAPLKPMDVLQAIWYAKILSGITTQSTNFFANIFNTVFELPVVALRISMLNGTPLGMLAGAKGFASGVAKGAVTAADIIKSGVRSKEVDKYFSENPLEYFTWSKWLGNKGKVLDYIPPLNFGAWKYVGRILAATDAFFATANQEAIANMLAYAEAAGTPAGNNFKKANEILGNNKMSVLRARAQAKAEGFEPGTIQYKRRELEIIAQKRTSTQEADEIGKRITMNYDPEGFTKPLFDAVVGLQENIPAIKMVIPFARIVANLTENGLNYSPFGFAKAVTGIKNPFQGLKSERMNFDQRTDMFYKSMLGMGMLLYILPHVGEDDDDWFEITAGGSTDLQKKYELQKGGWRPYTITFKDGTKISYKDWPTAGLLAGLGHVRDAKKYKIDDSTQTTLFATGFFLNLYDKSLLKGLQDLFGIIPKFNRGSYAPDDRMGERFTKYAAQQVKSVALSNLSQQSFKLYSELVTGDPQRDAKTFAQIIYRDIPILNDGIRPIIDVFGDEVPYTTTERLLPVMDSPEKEEIIEWLNKNKLFVGVPMRKNIKLLDGTERPMTDDEYYEYRKNAGKSVKKFINEFMSEIKNQDIGKEAFEKVVDAARQEAYGEILMKANNL